MSEEVVHELQHRVRHRPRFRVLPFFPEADLLIKHAQRVIAMGGYNTLCAVLSFEKKALIVPRTCPRKEQWIRAERLQELGLVDLLPPDELTGDRLSAWLSGQYSNVPNVNHRVDMGGLACVVAHVGSIARRLSTNVRPAMEIATHAV